METKLKDDVESAEPIEAVEALEKFDEATIGSAEAMIGSAEEWTSSPNPPDDCMYYDNTSVFIKSYFKKLAEKMPGQTTYYNKLGRLMAINDPDDEDFDIEMFNDSFKQIYQNHYLEKRTEHDAMISGAEAANETWKEETGSWESEAGPSKNTPAKNSFLDFAR